MEYNPQIGDLLGARDYGTNEISLGMIVNITAEKYIVEWLDGKSDIMRYGISDIIYFRDNYKTLRETF